MHWLTDPILKHYVDFKGRATREEFWMYSLFITIIYIALGVISGVLEDMVVLPTVITIFQLGILLPNIAIAVRRLQDINKSGWWLLISLVPIIGIIVLLIFYVKKGDEGDNEYGPSPKGPASDYREAEVVSDVPGPNSDPMNDAPRPPEQQ